MQALWNSATEPGWAILQTSSPAFGKPLHANQIDEATVAIR